MRNLTVRLLLRLLLILPLAATAADDWRPKVDALFTFQTTIASSTSRNFDAERAEYWRRVKELGSSLDETAQAQIAAAPVDAASTMALAAIDYAHDPQRVDELLGWYACVSFQFRPELRQKTLAYMKGLGYPQKTWVPEAYRGVDPRSMHGTGHPYDTFVVHLRPEYRTAWEALLFAPERLSPGQCQLALAAIRDPRSLALLREVQAMHRSAVRLF